MVVPRFRFKIGFLMLVVALVAVPMALLAPRKPLIEIFGRTSVRPDGSILVRDGSVRVSRGGQITEIEAGAILIQKDLSARVIGRGVMRQAGR